MKITLGIACALLATLLTVNVQAQLPWNNGDLVVYRVGDSTTPVNGALSVDLWLDEYTEAGALVGSIMMPTNTVDGQSMLTAQGNSTSEGLLTISPDEHWLALTGYGVAPGYNSPSLSSTVSRVVGIVNATNGVVDTSTALTDVSTTSSFRSAITTDGNKIWVLGGIGGAHYTTLGSPTSTALTNAGNLRQIEIYPTAGQTGGQLMFSDQSGSVIRLASVGSGLPTTANQTTTNLPGTTGASPSGPYAFVQLTLGNGSLPDTMYVANDLGSRVEKWSLVGGAWQLTGYEAVTAPRGVVACLTNVNNVLVADVFVTAGSSSTITNILEFTDSSGYDGTFSSGTNILVQLPAGEQFRGIVQLTIPEPSTVALVGMGLLGLFAIRRRRS